MRAVAASKIPVATGIGHEIDESLVDLAADIRASTPSNLAEMITLDKKMVISSVNSKVEKISDMVLGRIKEQLEKNQAELGRALREVDIRIDKVLELVLQKMKVLEALSPEAVLRRGYAILSGDVVVGNVVKITTFDKIINARLEKIDERK